MRFKQIIPIVLVFGLLFQSVLQKLVPLLRYYDEVIAIVIAICGMILLCKKEKVDRLILVMGLSILLFTVAGTLSSIILNYQSFDITLGGLFLSIKWWLLFVGVYSLTDTYMVEDIVSLPIICSLLFLLLVWQGLSIVYGLGEYSFKAWYVCANAVFMIGLLFFRWKNTKIEYVLLLLALLLAVSTGRAKGYGVVALAVLLLFWVLFKQKKVMAKDIIILGIALLIVAWRKIYYYYYLGWKWDYTRAYLLKKSIDIANDHFPLGTGWSTYGSYLSVENYSPTYWLYDMGYHREVGFTHRLFLNDNYIASVIGETGYLGLAALIAFCITLFIAIQRLYAISINLYAAGLVVFFYLLVTFVEESGLQQPALMSLAIMLGAVLGVGSRKKHTCADEA